MSYHITLAKNAGFCFGVKRALNLVNEALEDKSKKVIMLGSVIHNEYVVSDLILKGAKIVESLDSVDDDEDNLIVIRAHGEPKRTYDELEKRNLKYIDTTCPFVKKVHEIVKRQSENGCDIFIIGKSTHPEVIGIEGFSQTGAHIFKDDIEIEDFLKKNPQSAQNKVCLVSQTTMERKNWDKCLKTFNLEYTNSIIFDTICNATNERQAEAAFLAGKSDLMLVIGSKSSSNTNRLKEVIEETGTKVYLIENADELKSLGLKLGDSANIGVTAGASTPAFIIKEVVNLMSEEKNPGETGEMNFAEELDKSVITLNTGDVVIGVVSAITPTEVRMDLGVKSDGYIPIGELSDDPDFKPEEFIKVGDSFEVFVVRVNDVEGTIMLSKKKIESIKGWKMIEKSNEDGEVLNGIVDEAVKGGLIVLVNGARVFVPASLSADKFVPDLSSMVGKKVRLRIIEINKQRRRVTGSIKAVLDEERKTNSVKIWDDIQAGNEYQGVVKSIVSYGVFVDIGGVDGMVHISELSWNRVKNPSEIVKVGDILNVYVIAVNKESHKISLGHKKISDNPWNVFVEKYKVNDIIDCKIVKLMPFGAFAEIIPGIDGLIHISQIANRRIARPEEVLKVDQEVRVRITEIDLDKKKISLTIKGVDMTVDETASADESKEDSVSGNDTVENTLPDLSDGETPKEEEPIENEELSENA